MFLILNYWNYSRLLISTCTKIVDYKKQENHCKGPLLTYAGTNQGVKNKLFLGKYPLKVG